MNTEDRQIDIPFSDREPDSPANLSMHQDADGNYVLNLHKPKPRKRKGFHDENLAEILDDHVLSAISQDVIGGIDDDKNSRQLWAQIIDEGMEQLGLQIEERTWPFEGAAGTYSATLCQAWLTTSATIISELLPPNGPAKADLLGEPSDDQEDRAERIENWFNIFLTRINKSFYPDMEQAIMWAINNGSIFVKNYIDPISNMPMSLYIRPDDFIVNTSATSLALATRVTHQQTLSAKEVKLRQENGLYRDIDLHPDADAEIDKTLMQQRIEQIEGFQSVSYQYNKKFVIYESHVDLDLEKYETGEAGSEEMKMPKPYIVTLDRKSRKILAIYRNWDENDSSFKRIECFVPFTYIPGFGMYGLGLFHIAAGNAKAATQIGRQLMDAGTLSNFPGGIRVKGMRFEENNIRVGPTEYVEIDTGGLPIQQAIMPLPYKEPSSILKDLKDDLEKNIMDLTGAANSQISEIQSNMPVGTILSIIEVSQKVQSAVVQRMHRSMGEVFQILYRLFSKVLPEEPYPFHIAGKSQVIMRSDFKHDISVIPSSDPNLSSFPQRAMTVETILNTAKDFPDMHDMHAVLKRFYKILKVSNIDEILKDPKDEPEPQPLDPVSENMDAMNGKPLKAFMFQDQDSHMVVHSFVMSDPSTPPEVMQALKAHNQEHMAFKYMMMMQDAMKKQLPEDPSQLKPEQQNEIAMAAAQATQQMAQAQQEQKPPSIEQIAMEEVRVKDKEVDVHAEVEMAKLEVEKLKLELAAKTAEEKIMMDQLKLDLEQLKMEQEAKNKELQAETEAFKAQLKYHSEEDKLDSKSVDTEPNFE